MEKRFEEILNYIKNPRELRLNNMLDPYFLGADEEEKIADILFCTQDWERNQRNEIHGGAFPRQIFRSVSSGLFSAELLSLRHRLPVWEKP